MAENFYTVGELSYKYFGALEKFFSLKGKRNLATWKKIGKFSTQFLEIRLKHHQTSPVVNFHLDLTNKQFLTPLYRFRVENLEKIDGQKLYYGSNDVCFLEIVTLLIDLDNFHGQIWILRQKIAKLRSFQQISRYLNFLKNFHKGGPL